MSTDAPWDGMSSLIQTFNLADGPPRMLERMVPFYEIYIPIKCAGDPVKLKAALEALEARNTFLVEDIINPRPASHGWTLSAATKPRGVKVKPAPWMVALGAVKCPASPA